MLWPADVHICRRVTPASGVQDPAEQTQPHPERSRRASARRGNGFVLAINRLFVVRTPFLSYPPFLSYRAQSRYEHYEMGSFCVFSCSLNRIGGDSEACMTFVETRPATALWASLRARGFDLQNCFALVAIGWSFIDGCAGVFWEELVVIVGRGPTVGRNPCGFDITRFA